MIDEIYILEHHKNCDSGRCPGEKAGRLLRVIPDHHKLVVELREDGFGSFSENLVSPFGWSQILY